MLLEASFERIQLIITLLFLESEKNKEKWILFWYLQQLQGQSYKGLAIWLCLLFYEYSTTVVLESQIKMQSNYGI